MKCSELMKTSVECCDEHDLIETVARQMRERNVGFLPVCDDDGIAVGTITDRDMVIRVLAEGRSSEISTVADAMTRGVVTCRPEDDVIVAEQLMSQFKKSRILCVDERGRAVGVISLSDIARRESGGKASAVLRSVTQREARL